MKWVVLPALALAASACAYRPEPTDTIRIVDSPADVRVCTSLGPVSPTVATGPGLDAVLPSRPNPRGRRGAVVETGPGFDVALQSMLEATVALGGTDLYLSKRSHDWALVRGIAYRCGPGVRVRGTTVVVRAKG